MALKVVPSGANKKTIDKLKSLDKIINQGIRSGFFELSRNLQNTAKNKILDKNKNGVTYRIRVGKTFRNHRASAPQEPPAALTRNLIRNLRTIVRGSDELIFGVEDKAPYGRALELGDEPRLKPRPYLQPTMRENIGKAHQIFNENVIKELKK